MPWLPFRRSSPPTVRRCAVPTSPVSPSGNVPEKDFIKWKKDAKIFEFKLERNEKKAEIEDAASAPGVGVVYLPCPSNPDIRTVLLCNTKRKWTRPSKLTCQKLKKNNITDEWVLTNARKKAVDLLQKRLGVKKSSKSVLFIAYQRFVDKADYKRLRKVFVEVANGRGIIDAVNEEVKDWMLAALPEDAKNEAEDLDASDSCFLRSAAKQLTPSEWKQRVQAEKEYRNKIKEIVKKLAGIKKLARSIKKLAEIKFQVEDRLYDIAVSLGPAEATTTLDSLGSDLANNYAVGLKRVEERYLPALKTAVKANNEALSALLDAKEQRILPGQPLVPSSNNDNNNDSSNANANGDKNPSNHELTEAALLSELVYAPIGVLVEGAEDPGECVALNTWLTATKNVKGKHSGPIDDKNFSPRQHIFRASFSQWAATNPPVQKKDSQNPYPVLLMNEHNFIVVGLSPQITTTSISEEKITWKMGEWKKRNPEKKSKKARSKLKWERTRNFAEYFDGDCPGSLESKGRINQWTKIIVVLRGTYPGDVAKLLTQADGTWQIFKKLMANDFFSAKDKEKLVHNDTRADTNTVAVPGPFAQSGEGESQSKEAESRNGLLDLRVHQGFFERALEVAQSMEHLLKELFGGGRDGEKGTSNNLNRSTPEVVITGHSLGGAAAIQLALLIKNYKFVKNQMPQKLIQTPLRVITFGAPAAFSFSVESESWHGSPGSAQYNAKLQKTLGKIMLRDKIQITSFLNGRDPVPQLGVFFRDVLANTKNMAALYLPEYVEAIQHVYGPDGPWGLRSRMGLLVDEHFDGASQARAKPIIGCLPESESEKRPPDCTGVNVVWLHPTRKNVSRANLILQDGREETLLQLNGQVQQSGFKRIGENDIRETIAPSNLEADEASAGSSGNPAAPILLQNMQQAKALFDFSAASLVFDIALSNFGHWRRVLGTDECLQRYRNGEKTAFTGTNKCGLLRLGRQFGKFKWGLQKFLTMKIPPSGSKRSPKQIKEESDVLASFAQDVLLGSGEDHKMRHYTSVLLEATTTYSASVRWKCLFQTSREETDLTHFYRESCKESEFSPTRTHAEDPFGLLKIVNGAIKTEEPSGGVDISDLSPEPEPGARRDDEAEDDSFPARALEPSQVEQRTPQVPVPPPETSDPDPRALLLKDPDSHSQVPTPDSKASLNSLTMNVPAESAESESTVIFRSVASVLLLLVIVNVMFFCCSKSRSEDEDEAEEEEAEQEDDSRDWEGP